MSWLAPCSKCGIASNIEELTLTNDKQPQGFFIAKYYCKSCMVDKMTLEEFKEWANKKDCATKVDLESLKKSIEEKKVAKENNTIINK